MRGARESSRLAGKRPVEGLSYDGREGAAVIRARHSAEAAQSDQMDVEGAEGGMEAGGEGRGLAGEHRGGSAV